MTTTNIPGGPISTTQKRAVPRPRRRLSWVLLISAGYLLLLVAVALSARWIAPFGINDQDLTVVLQGPTAQHLLGTDSLGRDVMSRLMFGGRTTLLSSLEALITFLAIGIPLGIASGYRGGWLDHFSMRIVELVLSIPAIILVLVVLAVFPGNEHAAMVTLGILGAPGLIRVVRASTMATKQELFVSAAQVSGLAPLQIMRTHILRRALGPILVQASLFAAAAMLFESALGFLGLVSNGTDPTWGGMVGEAASELTDDPWLLVPSGGIIALTVLALGLLGDAIGDLAADAPPTARARSVRRIRGRTSAQPVMPAAVKGRPQRQATTAQALLQVVGLSLAVGDVQIVEDVSFTVGSGETLGLVGESGCGKTVTALAVLGLLPEGIQITAGQVIFDGVPVRGTASYRAVRGSGIAYIAQDALSSLDPTHTVGSQLGEVVRLHGDLSRPQIRARVRELLAEVSLSDPDRVARSYPHELSGGMAQRVCIAIALAGDPKLLIADEPTTALDVTVQAEILALLRRLRHSKGLALLLITHDWGVVADLCDRATVMYAGQVVEQCDVESIFASARHPYTEALLAANPSIGDGPLQALPGSVPPPGQWPHGCRFAARCSYAQPPCSAQDPVPLLPAGPDRVSRCLRIDAVATASTSKAGAS